MSSFNGTLLPSAVQWLNNPTSWIEGDQSRPPLQELDAEDCKCTYSEDDMVGLVCWYCIVDGRAHEEDVGHEAVEKRAEEDVEDKGKQNVQPRVHDNLFPDFMDSNHDVFIEGFDNVFPEISDIELQESPLGNTEVLSAPTTDQQFIHQEKQFNTEYQSNTSSNYQIDDGSPTKSKEKQKMAFSDVADYQIHSFAENEEGSFSQEDFEPYRMIDGVPYALDQTLPQGDENTVEPSKKQNYYAQDQYLNPQDFFCFTESNPSQLGFPELAAPQSGKQKTAVDNKRQDSPSGVKRTVKKGIDKRDKGEARIINGQLQQREGHEHGWGKSQLL